MMCERENERNRRGVSDEQRTSPTFENVVIDFELPDSEGQEVLERPNAQLGNAFWTEALRDIPREDALQRDVDELAEKLGRLVSIAPQKDDWDELELNEEEETFNLRVEEPPRVEEQLTKLRLKEIQIDDG